MFHRYTMEDRINFIATKVLGPALLHTTRMEEIQNREEVREKGHIIKLASDGNIYAEQKESKLNIMSYDYQNFTRMINKIFRWN